MTSYIVGCDNIVGGESGLIERVCKVFESKGHDAERLNVGPNYTQSSGLKSSSSGKVAVFIVGGSDIGTYVDFVNGIKRGYYHWKYAWFAFASWTATTDKWITKNGLKNTGLVRAHDDNFSSQSDIAPWLGKSADYFFSQNKQYVNYVYGQTPEELAKKILAGGGDDSKGDSSASTIKDAICEVASFWDGEVEIKIEQDKVKLRKIPDPEIDHLPLEIVEGQNVHLGSISVSDYHPDTVNLLKVHWQGGEDIIFKDDALIERFGEKPREMDAVKRVVKEDSEEDTSSSNTSTSTTSSTSDTTSSTDSTDATTAAVEEVEVEETSSVSTTSYEEIPVDTLEEAMTFANTEWAKIRRNNGHEVELKVIGDNNYVHGWVKVILFSYPTNMWMFAKAINKEINENGEFDTNITLVDYPPSLGEWNESDSDEEESEEDEETTDDEEVTV